MLADMMESMVTTAFPFRLGPEFTPSIVRKLLFYVIGISLGATLLNPFFTVLIGMPGPQQWLSLSWWGMERYMFWQPLTYLFVHPMGEYGSVGFSYFLTLIFNLYILWVMGSDICQKASEKSFLRLYLTCGIVAGIATLFLIPLIGQSTVLAGPAPAIFGLLICWAFLHPEQELLLFFLLPVKAKWLSLSIIGFALFVSLANLHLVYFLLYFSGALLGYLYPLIAWGVHSPFSSLYRLELAAVRASQKARAFIPKRKRGSKGKSKDKSKGKIVNIKTGEADDDEAFVDAMLEKISRYGEGSLTYSERERMKEISEKKRH